MEKHAPLSLAAAWDNVGLLLEAPSLAAASAVLLTNDLTEAVVEECIAKNVGLVIAYHPILFSGAKRLRLSDWKERVVLRCIQGGISVYSPHTALDSCRNGVNDWLSSIFAKSARPIVPNPSDAAVGDGRFATLQVPISIGDAIGLAKEKFRVPFGILALS